MSQIKTFWEKIQSQICAVCRDYTRPGCKLEGGEGCTLFRNFPKLVPVVQFISKSPASYIQKTLRRYVCGHCRNQDRRGRCVLRNNHDCVLDSHLDQIISALSKS